MIHTRLATRLDFQGLPEPVLRAYENSLRSWAVYSDESLLAAYGYAAPVVGEEAFVWFYPVRDLTAYRLRFFRESRRFISELLQKYPVLHGSVDPELPKACQWLRWLGFKEVESLMFGDKVFKHLELRRA